jgi:hypothetical protein
MRTMGVARTSFGDSTGSVSALLACLARRPNTDMPGWTA